MEKNEEKILREEYIPPELRQKIIDGLRLKEENYWWSKINIIMEYQKIISLLENTPNQLSKFRIKNWDEVNDESVELIILIVKLNLKFQC